MVWPGTFSGSFGRQKIRSHFRSSLRFFRQACESDMAEFFSTSQILCNLAICKISSTVSQVTPQAESIEMVQYSHLRLSTGLRRVPCPTRTPNSYSPGSSSQLLEQRRGKCVLSFLQTVSLLTYDTDRPWWITPALANVDFHHHQPLGLSI